MTGPRTRSATGRPRAPGRVVATFQPQRLDTLRPRAEPWIGWRGEWSRLWVADEGQYAGQTVWWIDPIGGDPYLGWVPDEDLADVAPA